MRGKLLGRIAVGVVLCLLLLAESAAASVVIRIMATNPSETTARQVPVKVYLPVEAKPEDVIDAADLQVGYDAQQGSYYVYGTYEVEPLGTVEREIEIRDIWVIEQAELASIREEAQKIRDILKNTEFKERVNYLTDSVISKISDIEERQSRSDTNPEDHISNYRYNQQLLKNAKSDLAVARSMLGKEKKFSAGQIWRLILYIIIFLGILGLSFYYVWHRQVNRITGKEEPPEEEGAAQAPSAEEAAEQAGPSEEEDIEKMLGVEEGEA